MRYAQILKCPVFENDGWVKLIFLIGRLNVMDSTERGNFFRTEERLRGLCEGSVLEPIVEGKLLGELCASVKKVAGSATPTAGQQQQPPGDLNQAQLEKQELLTALPLLFSLLPNLSKEKFLSTTVPLVPSLFAISDRAVRATLLTALPTITPQLGEHLGGSESAKFINSKIFDPLCSGFTDSEPQLREITLKSCLPLISHLTPANLEKLARYLVRLQNDPVPGIRTNTVIFIGKITPKLTTNGREKVTLPAFVRACRDPFVYVVGERAVRTNNERTTDARSEATSVMLRFLLFFPLVSYCSSCIHRFAPRH